MKVDEDLFVEIVRCLAEGQESNYLFYSVDVVAYHLDVLEQQAVVRRKDPADSTTGNSARTAVQRYELNEPLDVKSKQLLTRLLTSV